MVLSLHYLTSKFVTHHLPDLVVLPPLLPPSLPAPMAGVRERVLPLLLPPPSLPPLHELPPPVAPPDTRLPALAPPVRRTVVERLLHQVLQTLPVRSQLQDQVKSTHQSASSGLANTAELAQKMALTIN